MPLESISQHSCSKNNPHNVRVHVGTPLQKSQTTQHLRRYMGIQLPIRFGSKLPDEEGHHRVSEGLAWTCHPQVPASAARQNLDLCERSSLSVCVCVCLVLSPVGSVITLQYAGRITGVQLLHYTLAVSDKVVKCNPRPRTMSPITNPKPSESEP